MMIQKILSILTLAILATGVMTSCQKNETNTAEVDFDTKTVNLTVTGMT